MDLQEKIKLSEKLTDQYLDEVGVMAVNTAIAAVNTAQGVSHDMLRLRDWTKKKLAMRKREKEKEKRKKEKEKAAKRKASGRKVSNKKSLFKKIKW